MPPTVTEATPAPEAVERQAPVRSRARARLAAASWAPGTALMLALALYRLTRPELWRDELASWSAATRSTSQLFALLHHLDAVFSGYYLFLHVWTGVFGDSAFALRLPTVLAMTGACAATAVTARRLFGVRAGLAAGVVFAIIPASTRFAQEARPYAFVILFAALSCYFLVRAIEAPSWRWWAAYAGAVVLLACAHMVALILLSGHLIVVGYEYWRRRDRGLLGFVPAGLAAVLVVMPLILLAHQQVGSQIAWLITPSVANGYEFWVGMFCSATMAGTVPVLAAFAPQKHRAASAWIAAAAVPLVALWLVSQVSQSFFFPRYLLFVLPVWAIVAGAGLAQLRLRYLLVACAALLAMTLPDHLHLREPQSHSWTTYPYGADSNFISYKSTAAVVAKGTRPGDAIVYGNPNGFQMVELGVRYYLPGLLQGRTPPRPVFIARTPAMASNFTPRMTTDPKSRLAGVRRVWLVATGRLDDPLSSLPDDEAAALRSGYTVTMKTFVNSATVALYTVRTPPVPTVSASPR